MPASKLRIAALFQSTRGHTGALPKKLSVRCSLLTCWPVSLPALTPRCVSIAKRRIPSTQALKRTSNMCSLNIEDTFTALYFQDSKSKGTLSARGKQEHPVNKHILGHAQTAHRIGMICVLDTFTASISYVQTSSLQKTQLNKCLFVDVEKGTVDLTQKTCCGHCYSVKILFANIFLPKNTCPRISVYVDMGKKRHCYSVNKSH